MKLTKKQIEEAKNKQWAGELEKIRLMPPVEYQPIIETGHFIIDMLPTLYDRVPCRASL